MKVFEIDATGRKGELRLDDKRSLGSGGAGTVYSVTGESRYVVKIYHPNETRDNEEKIKSMIAAPPQGVDFEFHNIKFPQFTWPRAAVYSGVNGATAFGASTSTSI